MDNIRIVVSIMILTIEQSVAVYANFPLGDVVEWQMNEGVPRQLSATSTVFLPNARQCLRLCWYSSDCADISYDLGSQTCRLFDKASHMEIVRSLVDMPGEVFVNLHETSVEQIPQMGCLARPCSADKICVPDTWPRNPETDTCLDVVDGLTSFFSEPNAPAVDTTVVDTITTYPILPVESPTEDVATRDTATADATTTEATDFDRDVNNVDNNNEDVTTRDTAIGDTTTADTTTRDTAIGDTMTADAITRDTAIGDTITADTITRDFAIEDTMTADATTRDTAIEDTTTADTIIGDITTADTIKADTTIIDEITSDPSTLNCGTSPLSIENGEVSIVRPGLRGEFVCDANFELHPDTTRTGQFHCSLANSGNDQRTWVLNAACEQYKFTQIDAPLTATIFKTVPPSSSFGICLQAVIPRSGAGFSVKILDSNPGNAYYFQQQTNLILQLDVSVANREARINDGAGVTSTYDTDYYGTPQDLVMVPITKNFLFKPGDDFGLTFRVKGNNIIHVQVKSGQQFLDDYAVFNTTYDVTALNRIEIDGDLYVHALEIGCE